MLSTQRFYPIEARDQQKTFEMMKPGLRTSLADAVWDPEILFDISARWSGPAKMAIIMMT